MKDRLEKQLDFFLEADKLKQVNRQNYILNGRRKENDGEHCWHLALMCMLLHEYARDSEEIDLLHTIKMVLVHDLVEIDAGDTYCYDEEASVGKEKREREAAERIFKLLPPNQEQEFRALWEEFEAMNTPEARFAAALDRFQPMLLNYFAQGKSWQEHGITHEQVIRRNSVIGAGSPALWDYARELIADAVKRGFLKQ